MENIILIGMPGSGKSTIGVVLAKALGYSFIDSDLLIQEKYQKKLSQLIDENGDAGFIQIENDVNKQLSPQNTIIATGGSAVYGKEAMEHFKEIGTIIYLQVPYKEIETRVGSLHQRGVVSNGKHTIEEIFADRSELYEQYADATIHGQGREIREIVEEISSLLNIQG